jgi:2-oxoglutarate dehydrogenase E2 component (dihydrolipoamide succinyltransferase)
MARRRHAAPGGRVLATGVSVSATLGIMAGFAVEARTVTASTPTPSTTEQDADTVVPTTIVTRVVERTIYVPAGGAAAATSGRSGAGGPAGSSSGAAGSSGGSSASAAPTQGAPAAAPAPAPAAPTPSPPVCSGSKC